MAKAAQLRTYPWPYKASLAISNDCDFLTLDAMLALHQLFAEPETSGGIGIDFSDSFFFYQNGSLYPQYSYFDGVSSAPSAAAPVIREMIKGGHLDTIHGLGDFERGGFSRRHTEQACGEMAKHGLSLSVFSNHGGYSNWQNIGRKEFATYHSGDDFFSQYYHLDLLESLGCRYFWTDVAKTKRISLSPSGPVVTERARKAPKLKWVWPLQRIRQHKLEWNYDRTDVFEEFQTRSARRLQGFVRYDGFFPDGDAGLDAKSLLTPAGIRAGPNLGRIAISLTDKLLGHLVTSGGCCFLYQHFSTLAHVPSRTHISKALEFHPENLAALRRLEGYHRRGDIWVAAQRALLDYLYLRNTCEVVKKETHEGKLVYQAIVKRGYEFRGLEGLTFALDGQPRSSGERLQDVVIVDPTGKISPCNIDGPDGSGTYWASIPVRRLSKLDWVALAREANISLSPEINVKLLDGSRAVDLTLPRELDQE